MEISLSVRNDRREKRKDWTGGRIDQMGGLGLRNDRNFELTGTTRFQKWAKKSLPFLGEGFFHL